MESDSFSIESVLADFENRFSSNLATEKLIDYWEFLEEKTKKIRLHSVNQLKLSESFDNSLSLEDFYSAPAPNDRHSLAAVFNQHTRQVSYEVPALSDDGACTLHTVLREERFTLNPFLQSETMKLWPCFDFVIEALQNKTEADWAGIYLKIKKNQLPPEAHQELERSKVDAEEILVKVAYRGKPSRAIFPLNQDFLSKSNNVAAVWNNRTILVRDVRAHEASGGSYYQCDPLVQSELCLPISREGKVEGLIDLEGFHKDQFSERDIGYALVTSQFILRLLHT